MNNIEELVADQEKSKLNAACERYMGVTKFEYINAQKNILQEAMPNINEFGIDMIYNQIEEERAIFDNIIEKINATLTFDKSTLLQISKLGYRNIFNHAVKNYIYRNHNVPFVNKEAVHEIMSSIAAPGGYEESLLGTAEYRDDLTYTNK